MTTCDVVVVGARCAGAVTAMLLARAGFEVLVLERARPGTDTVSTHALMRGAVLQLDRFGLLDQVIAAGTPPVTRTVFHYADQGPVPVSIRPAAGVSALYAPRRTVLDPILVRAAAEAGAEVRHGVTVTGLLRGPAGRVAGVTGVDRAGRPVRARARFVVGADGARSTVAGLAGARTLYHGRSGLAYLYGYAEDLPVPGYEMIFTPGLLGGFTPTNDGRTCVFAGATPQRMRRLRAEGAGRALHRCFDLLGPAPAARLAAARPPAVLRGYGGAPGHLRQAYGPGWALVGDAGYYKDPITTHGISDAFRDAETLAGALTEALTGAEAETAALERYRERRDRLAAPMLRAAENLAAMDWDMERLRRLLRMLNSAMAENVQALSDDRGFAHHGGRLPHA